MQLQVKCVLVRVRKYISGEAKNIGKVTGTNSSYDTGVDNLDQMSKNWNVLSWLAAANSWSRKHVGLYNDGRVEIRTQWNEGKGERLEASHLFHHIRRRTEATRSFTSSFWRESQNAASSWPIPATPKFTFLLMVPSELVPINNAGRYNARGTKPARSHFVGLQFSRMIYLKNIYKLLFVLLQQT